MLNAMPVKITNSDKAPMIICSNSQNVYNY